MGYLVTRAADHTPWEEPVARRTLDLDVSALRALRPRTGTCLRWKYDRVTVERTPETDAGHALERWIAEVEEHWGACGRILQVDDEPAAYVLYAPPVFLPGLGDVPTAPASADAVVLAELCLLPEAGGTPAAKHLIQSVARDLHRRDVAALEAFGSLHPATEEAREPARSAAGDGDDPSEPAELSDFSDRCVLPVPLLDSVGFTTHRAHSTTPRMRMELRGARTWKNEVELALERLVGAVRPASKPSWGPSALEPKTPAVRSGPQAP